MSRGRNLEFDKVISLTRRKLLVGAAGVFGAGAPLLALAQTRPCPVPELRVDDQVVQTSCGGSALETAAAALSAGQRSTSLGDSGLTSDALFTIQWVNRFHYDHANARAHLLGKNAASQGRERSNCMYDAGSNRWTCDVFGGDETGHVYESFAYDPALDTVYSGRWGSSPTPIQTWRYGSDLSSWGTTSTAPWAFSNTNSTQPVLCWHPNLFGQGDGGLIAIHLISGTNVQLVAWRRSTNAWSTIAGSLHSAGSGASQHGAIEYVRSAGHAVATFALGDTFTIGAGNAGSSASAVRMQNPPMPCRHAGGGNNVGILIDDPRGAAGPYILEKGGSNRVWKWLSGSWSLRSYTHPFPYGSATDDTNWTVASLYPLGVFWARGNRTSEPSMLWRPND